MSIFVQYASKTIHTARLFSLQRDTAVLSLMFIATSFASWTIGATPIKYND